MNWLDYLTLAFAGGALVFNVIAMAEIRKRRTRRRDVGGTGRTQ